MVETRAPPSEMIFITGSNLLNLLRWTAIFRLMFLLGRSGRVGAIWVFKSTWSMFEFTTMFNFTLLLILITRVWRWKKFLNCIKPSGSNERKHLTLAHNLYLSIVPDIRIGFDIFESSECVYYWGQYYLFYDKRNIYEWRKALNIWRDLIRDRFISKWLNYVHRNAVLSTAITRKSCVRTRKILKPTIKHQLTVATKEWSHRNKNSRFPCSSRMWGRAQIHAFNKNVCLKRVNTEHDAVKWKIEFNCSSIAR